MGQLAVHSRERRREDGTLLWRRRDLLAVPAREDGERNPSAQDEGEQPQGEWLEWGCGFCDDHRAALAGLVRRYRNEEITRGDLAIAVHFIMRCVRQRDPDNRAAIIISDGISEAWRRARSERVFTDRDLRSELGSVVL